MKWFRFYTEALDDPKVQGLPPALFKHWVNVLALAAQGDGVLPAAADVAFRLRIPHKLAVSLLSQLQECGLIDADGETLHPHNWNGRQYQSDNVTDRVRSFRERSTAVTGNVSRNDVKPLHVTPPEQNRTEQTQNRPDPLSFGSRPPAREALPDGWIDAWVEVFQDQPTADERRGLCKMAGYDPQPAIHALRWVLYGARDVHATKPIAYAQAHIREYEPGPESWPDEGTVYELAENRVEVNHGRTPKLPPGVTE